MECGQKCRSLVWRGKAEIANDRHRWLLRPHDQRPKRCRTNYGSDEISPAHLNPPAEPGSLFSNLIRWSPSGKRQFVRFGSKADMSRCKRHVGGWQRPGSSCASTCGQFLYGLGRQRLAANAPLAAVDLKDFHPCHAAHIFTFDRNHGIGQFLNNLLFLLCVKDAFDQMDIDLWHCLVSYVRALRSHSTASSADWILSNCMCTGTPLRRVCRTTQLCSTAARNIRTFSAGTLAPGSRRT